MAHPSTDAPAVDFVRQERDVPGEKPAGVESQIQRGDNLESHDSQRQAWVSPLIDSTVTAITVAIISALRPAFAAAYSDFHRSRAVANAVHLNSDFMHHRQQDIRLRRSGWANHMQIAPELPVGVTHQKHRDAAVRERATNELMRIAPELLERIEQRQIHVEKSDTNPSP